MISRASLVNNTLGLRPRLLNKQLPWFDKWLPAQFDNLYILPSIMVQQIKQGDEATSSSFKKFCMQ